jgi:hypothetical protein
VRAGLCCPLARRRLVRLRPPAPASPPARTAARANPANPLCPDRCAVFQEHGRPLAPPPRAPRAPGGADRRSARKERAHRRCEKVQKGSGQPSSPVQQEHDAVPAKKMVWSENFLVVPWDTCFTFHVRVVFLRIRCRQIVVANACVSPEIGLFWVGGGGPELCGPVVLIPLRNVDRNVRN